MRAALRGFFDDRHVGDQATIDGDVAAYRAANGRGESLLPLDEAPRWVAGMTRGEPSA
jgi:hypothetical protein